MHTIRFMILVWLFILECNCGRSRVLGLSVAINKWPVCNRRQAFRVATTTTTATILLPFTANARAPGSKDVSEAVTQIQDAAQDLRKLQSEWNLYTVIDQEGRTGSTDGARRILGGIAPQAGSAAIAVAKKTPLYRIDVAFKTVRNAALEGDETTAWASSLDLEKFEELADRILYETQKADGNFYSVLFAAKGTKMIQDIFEETRLLVKQGITDLDEMLVLLKDAGAPGV